MWLQCDVSHPVSPPHMSDKLCRSNTDGYPIWGIPNWTLIITFPENRHTQSKHPLWVKLQLSQTTPSQFITCVNCGHIYAALVSMSAGEASSEINTHYYSIASQLHAAQLVLLQIISLRKLMLENNITDSNIWVETHHIIPLTLPGK